MKKIVSMLLVLTMIFCLVACSEKGNSEKENVNAQIKKTTTAENFVVDHEITTKETITEETVTEAPRLSNECDKVLCSGRDGDDGPLYELVAIQTEDYSGVVTKIGVIKDNEWLVELSADNPLVEEDGTLKGYNTNSIDDFFEIEYIDNGCFYYCAYKNPNSPSLYEDVEVFYNSENGKSFCRTYVPTPSHVFCEYQPKEGDYLEKVLVTGNNGKILFAAYGGYDYYEYEGKDGQYMIYHILDLETMTEKEVKASQIDVNANYYFYPYAEGLFAVVGYNTGLVFYDIDGNCVLDLTEYELTHDFQKFFFKDGKCTFSIVNSNGTNYEITINKEGNVISSTEV